MDLVAGRSSASVDILETLVNQKTGILVVIYSYHTNWLARCCSTVVVWKVVSKPFVDTIPISLIGAWQETKILQLWARGERESAFQQAWFDFLPSSEELHKLSKSKDSYA